ncbi:MAG: hypothetical protein FWH27_02120, partial [Planctomycetaceae bacterium]|nr:hypothetical protein [Planctomycetaceae bacterium]
WNYNERNLTKRGVNQLKVYTSFTAELPPKPPQPAEGGQPGRGGARGGGGGQQEDPTHYLIGEFNLRQGSSDGPQILTFPAQINDRPVTPNDRRGRYLIFEILSNHNGVTFPIPEPEEPKEGEEAPEPQTFDDNAFVGLSEVKVIHQVRSGGLYEVEPLVVAKFSSELVARTHERSVKHLTDGSGLLRPERGWNRQGMPFYMGGVSYTQTFDLGTKSDSKYVVSLGKWLGSVAKVIVNGEEAGHIAYAPWEYDVSKFVKSGRNEISIVVVGTPKNLLGPHHNGPMRGSAWPNAFWNAPNDGPPSGSSYDVIGYGMFEPFVVIQR